MTLFTFSLILSTAGAALWVFLLPKQRREREFNRLVALQEHDPSVDSEDEVAQGFYFEQCSSLLEQLSDSLGKAGFISPKQRRQAQIIKASSFLLGSIGGIIIGFLCASRVGSLLGLGIGLYLALLLWSTYVRIRRQNYEREIMYQTPLVLESLILLVESGLGILPALEQVVSAEKDKSNPVMSLLHIVYRFSSHGTPFSSALKMVAEAVDVRVLRHVLVHLDISGTEGGELIPSLRSLSEHAHTEWKISVERRVKRLENLIVFPVFASVLGLMLLTAAVPLVPILELQDQMNESGRVVQELQQGN